MTKHIAMCAFANIGSGRALACPSSRRKSTLVLRSISKRDRGTVLSPLLRSSQSCICLASHGLVLQLQVLFRSKAALCCPGVGRQCICFAHFFTQCSFLHAVLEQQSISIREIGSGCRGKLKLPQGEKLRPLETYVAPEYSEDPQVMVLDS
jgi:hypothetical protein